MPLNITSQAVQHNSHSSFNLNVLQKIPSMPKKQFTEFKAAQHRELDKIIKEKRYKPGPAATLRDILNCSDKQFESRVGQESLARRQGVSSRTIRNYYKKFEADGVIEYSKNGWKHSNTTVLICLKPKLNHKAENFSYYLTPHDFPSGNHHEGVLGNNKESALGAIAGARAELSEHDAIPPEPELTEEDKQRGVEKLKEIRAMLWGRTTQ